MSKRIIVWVVRVGIVGALSLLILYSVSEINKTKRSKGLRLTVEDLKNCPFEDPFSEPIWNFYNNLCEVQEDKRYPNCEILSLDLLSENLRNTCLILRFDGYFSGGGLQEAIVLDDIKSSEEFLELSIKAFQHFGDNEAVEILKEAKTLIPKHFKLLEEEGISSPLEALNERYEKIYGQCYQTLYDLIQASPRSFAY